MIGMMRLICLLPLVALTACATAYWSPPDWPPPAVEGKIESETSLSEILESPDRFQDRFVMLDGVVCATHRQGDVTQLELHLLNERAPRAPVTDVPTCQERLLARFRGLVEPAIPPGTHVTLIGHVRKEWRETGDKGLSPLLTMEAVALAVWP